MPQVSDPGSGKEILIIAGPNGAGKTTFARRYLKLGKPDMPFVNADSIAAGLPSDASSNTEFHAGRLMLAELDRLAGEGRSFAFETTLSGRGYLRRIRQWRSDGYRVLLMFRFLPSADEAIERVRLRASQGGHDVPEDRVRRRFEAGMRNFRELYSKEVDAWVLYDGLQFTPVATGRSEDLDASLIGIISQR